MATPKILLLSRRSLEHNAEKLKEQFPGIDVAMAVAVAPEDAAAALKLTEAVAEFQQITAIVADFDGDMLIDENGKVELLGMTVFRDKEKPISHITPV